MSAVEIASPRDMDVERRERAAPAVSEGTALIQMIERVARDPSVDLQKMSQLLDMQERIFDRQARAAFAKSFAKMQPELPVITERGRIEVKDKRDDNRVIQSTKYALWEDINEAIAPVLAKNGFGLNFRVGTADDGKILVTGILRHKEGHQEETTLSLPHDSTGSKNAVQAVGSSVSYGKRYTAGLLLNFTSRGEDDDGRRAGESSTISEAQYVQLGDLMREVKQDVERFCRHFGIESVGDLPAARFAEAVAALNAKKVRQ